MVPRWLLRLLSTVVPPNQEDEALGDLEELHGIRVKRRGRALGTLATVVDGLWLVVVFSLGRLRHGLHLQRWMSGSELRLSLRLIRRQPIMTATSVLSLAVGIGMAAAGFGVYNQIAHGELPFENGDRFMLVEARSADDGVRTSVDLERLTRFRESASSFDYVGGLRGSSFNVVHTSGEVESVDGAFLTPGSFRYLPYTPTVGRLLVDADGRAGATPVALIRESLWARRFDRSASTIGTALDVQGEEYLIVGVLPDSAGFPDSGEIWLPLDERTLDANDDRDPVGATLFGVLTSEATPQRAAEQLADISDQVAAQGRGAERQRYRVTPLAQLASGPQVQLAAFLAIGMLVLVLLIVAANVTNLVMARTSRRTSELAVRTALGASRPRLVGQLFTEVLVMGTMSALLGLVAAGFVLRWYDRMLDELPFWIELKLDLPTVAFVALLTLLVSAVMGLAPALRATKRDPARALQDMGRGTLGIGRLGGTMIVLEVALSVALVGTAVVFARAFAAYAEPSLDLPSNRVLTTYVAMDIEREAASEAMVRESVLATVQAVRASLAQVPGVDAVTLASDLPRTKPRPVRLRIEVGPGELDPGDLAVPVVRVSPGFFDVMDVALMSGRAIVAMDFEEGAGRVAVVNESFARERFGTTQVVGRRVGLIPSDPDATLTRWHEIVGVAPDMMDVTGSAGRAGVYLPLETLRTPYVAIRVASSPLQFAGPLRRAIYDVDPEIELGRIALLEDVANENQAAMLAISSAMTGIGLLALLLSLAGVYSIMSLAVTHRTREIGIRVALGAEPSSVLASVVRRSGGILLLGAFIGTGFGFLLQEIDAGLTFNLPDPGPWLFPAVVLLVCIAGALASWIPARRALAIRPVQALRYD